MLRSRIRSFGSSNRLTIQRSAPRVEAIAAFSLVEPGAQLLVGLRQVVQLLSLLDGSPAHMPHGAAQRSGCAVARPAVANLRHIIEPLVRLWCITMLAEFDQERLQRR